MEVVVFVKRVSMYSHKKEWSVLEQGINITLCAKLGKNASDTCAIFSIWCRKQMIKFAM
jgi:hypothetical protein